MRVKVHKNCFLGKGKAGRRVRKGSIVEHDGPLSDWMEPLDQEPPEEADPSDGDGKTDPPVVKAPDETPPAKPKAATSATGPSKPAA